MKTFVLIALTFVLGACASRPVEVTTGAPPANAVALNVTNNASQAVNVYVTSGGTDTFVGQVAPNSTQMLNVSGIAAGSSVTLKARLADGTRTYTRDNVTLSGTTAWTVP